MYHFLTTQKKCEIIVATVGLRITAIFTLKYGVPKSQILYLCHTTPSLHTTHEDAILGFF